MTVEHRRAESVLATAGATAWCTCGASFFARYPDIPAPNTETTEQHHDAKGAVIDLVEQHIAAALAEPALIVRPGETLVITLERGLRDDEFAELAQRIRERLPETANVLVIEGATGLAVVSPESAP